MDTYGRNRDSLANIEENLELTFSEHYARTTNPEGEECVPVEVVPDIIISLAKFYNGRPILNNSEMDMLRTFTETNGSLLVTPAALVSLIAGLTKSSPSDSPQNSALELSDERDALEGPDAHYSGHESYSRPSSRGPPQTPKNSVFDTHRRQRSTPLGSAAPSSWASRPAPPSRRKSDAGNRSDSDSGAYGRSLSRTRSRAPSNPTSPTQSQSADLSSSLGSPPYRNHSRPASRVGRSRTSASPYDEHEYSSPDDSHDATASYNYRGQRDDHEFLKTISSLPMPRGSDSDSDDDDAEGLGLVMDRDIASSTASMEPQERVEALVKMNQEIQHRAAEADRNLRRKLEEHENEIETYQIRLDELSTELNASKREEKDLRNKERGSQTTIASLEAEVTKLTKQLDTSRINYANLQKLYQDQCAVSETYRTDLRQRDERIRVLLNSQTSSDMEAEKSRRESEAYEQRIIDLEAELASMQQVSAQLDEQKQENLLLKETIDRMRFDMDELRSNLTNATLGGPSSGANSAANTISKSLGAELASKIKDGWGSDEETEHMEEEDNSFDNTVVEESEDEDVIQTIITRKRKVASRANKIETITTHEEIREYSDSSVQYEPQLFLATTATQTPPEPKILRSSFSIQTDPVPQPEPKVIVRTPTPPPARVMVEMDIQTEENEREPSRSPSPDETMVSSSSTVMPSSSKTDVDHLDIPLDQPPAYNQLSEQQEWHDAAATLKKWHAGLKLPVQGVPGGLPAETAAEWKALKEELGVECGVIEKMIAQSAERPPSKDDPKGKRRRGRFYNIYNTYVYDGSIPTTAIIVGTTAIVVLALSPYLSSAPSIPGGATYYDRQAWNSFNSIHAAGEGYLPPDGTSTVWNFLGRVGGGAARAARGWPT